MSGGLVQRLLEVRAGAPLLENVVMADCPCDLAGAYQVADEIVAVLSKQYGPVVGYKVGATSVAGQHLLGLAEPFYGRVFAQRVLKGEVPCWGGDLRASSVEAEVGFLIGADLPPRVPAYPVAEVANAIRRVVPLFEINRPSYARPFEVGGLCLIADNGVTQAFAVGSPGVPFRLELALGAEAVTLYRNGVACAAGNASAVLGDPVRAVVWLANALRARGHTLYAGQLIASGAMTPPVPIAPGDQFEAEYATIGHVKLTIAE